MSPPPRSPAQLQAARSTKGGAAGGATPHLREVLHINKELLALGAVMAALAADGGAGGRRQSIGGGSAARHVPYRDSKLTRVLQVGAAARGALAACLLACVQG